MGILMMGAQVAGAYLGAAYMALISWAIYPMQPVETSYTFFAMMQEITGTFIFVLFFKIVSDERLHFTKENAINCFIIASSYVAARTIVNGVKYYEISSYGACLNPAVAVGITLMSLWTDAGSSLKWFWLYWLLPFVGSIIAIIFYRFIYLKTQLMVLRDEFQKEEVNDIENATLNGNGDGRLDE